MAGLMAAAPRLPVVVLISGEGSNLQALLDAAQAGALPVEIRAVYSNRDNAYGLERARRAGIPAGSVVPADFTDTDRYEHALADAIDKHSPGLVVLAGFMRILSAAFVRHYRGRMFNIHPSLLPRYRGLHTHRRVLQAGDARHGASVHFVTEELDGGPVVVQGEIDVQPDDNEQSLARRVRQMEYIIYPQAIRLFASGRLHMRHGHAELDGQVLTQPLSPEPLPTH